MHLLIALLCTASLGLAEPDPPPAAETVEETQDTATLRYEAMLRPEYLQGEPILVPVRITNAGDQPYQAPDLERRPWLVAFTFDQGNGQLERRRTTPPTTDPGRTVRLSPRSQRHTLLEVPASSSLAVAEYRLQVTLDPDTVPRVLATDSIRVAKPRPVEGDLGVGVSAASREVLATTWLHEASEGFDLYLSNATYNAPGRQGTAIWLAHLDEKVRPMLSESSSGPTGTRHVVWADGKQGIGWLSVEGSGDESIASSVETPWPELELVARPATDQAGTLHVPIWVPAPKGSAGELRVVSIGKRGAVSFRRAAMFSKRPESIASTVDDGGAVNLLVTSETNIDLFSIRSASGSPDLPLPGRRLFDAPKDHKLVDARFGLLSASEGHSGGLAALVTSRSASGIQSQWVGLRGTSIRSLPPVVLPVDGKLVEILPGSIDTVGYLIETGSRTALYTEGAKRAQLESSLHGDWGLVRDAKGAPTMRRLVRGGPVEATAIPIE